VEWGVEGLSNFKSRFIEDREAINQKPLLAQKPSLFSLWLLFAVSFN
jgi:hypothetical protein